MTKLWEKAGKKEAVTAVSNDEPLTIKRQCELLEINRTSFYYTPRQQTAEEKELEELVKARIDYWHTRFCYMGVRRIKSKLEKEDNIKAGRKLIRRYMEEMNIYAVYPKPNLSKRNKKHPVFPYLLINMNIFIPNQVWAVDITYIKMGKSHMYLTAVIDGYSRFIVGWELSDTLDTAPVLDAVKKAVAAYGVPGILNSDQGSNFTSTGYTGYLKGQKIRQSMDGKARWVDNVIIERWFRSLKTEYIYINEYKTPKELRSGIRSYVEEYNAERPHQSLGNNYPADVFAGRVAA
jgi:putative transposase